MGWPSEIPEPFTFRIERSSQSQPLRTAKTCAAKASFNSTRPISAHANPVLAKSLWTAGTGPMPMREGSHPAAAQPTKKADGVKPSSAKRSSATTRQAEAASFCWLELPAVQTPPATIGFNFASEAAVVSARMPSSLQKEIGSPPRWGMGTATISSSNRPSAQARAART